MIFRMTLKDPDGVDNAKKKALDAVINSSEMSNLDQDEKDVIYELRTEKLSDFLSKWVLYEEYITLEFDTENNSVRVLTKDEGRGC